MISKLVVQAVDDIYDNNTGSTYRRTFIRNIAPLYLRLANWPFNHVDYSRNHGKLTSDGRAYVLSLHVSILTFNRLPYALFEVVRRVLHHHACGKSLPLRVMLSTQVLKSCRYRALVPLN